MGYLFLSLGYLIPSFLTVFAIGAVSLVPIWILGAFISGLSEAALTEDIIVAWVLGSFIIFPLSLKITKKIFGLSKINLSTATASAVVILTEASFILMEIRITTTGKLAGKSEDDTTTVVLSIATAVFLTVLVTVISSLLRKKSPRSV